MKKRPKRRAAEDCAMTKSLIPDFDIRFLHDAAAYLESPSYLRKLADYVGVPLQRIAGRVVPARVAELGNKVLREVMARAADSVFATQGHEDFEQAYRASGWSGFWHRLASTATGGLGGALGFAGLAVELPITTGIMLRSIATIAGEFGEAPSTHEVRLECLNVFLLGGNTPDDDAMDSSYLTARMGMEKLVRDAAEFLATRSAKAVSKAISTGSAPPLLNFLNRIAGQFNITISQKFMAQSIPVVGIITGAAINNAFAGHFNSVAQYHFGIRRLERLYGKTIVQTEYRRQLDQIRGIGANDKGENESVLQPGIIVEQPENDVLNEKSGPSSKRASSRQWYH